MTPMLAVEVAADSVAAAADFMEVDSVAVACMPVASMAVQDGTMAAAAMLDEFVPRIR
ncbi:hypothetical protein Bra471DRAFT_00046 [Bradyrhizobium sp. WSM471]|nr:hypothetical protein Bra471DRAFT_00046 [Bradyrhizobium sp. WSM471]